MTFIRPVIRCHHWPLLKNIALFEEAVKHADSTNSRVNRIEEEMDVESVETEQEMEVVVVDEIKVDASIDGEGASR